MSRPEDEFTDQPPPRRPRRDDLEFQDDPDDVRLPPTHRLTGLDKTFADTHIVTLILFSVCCGGIAFILGVIGLAICKDPRARQNALIVTILSAVLTAISVLGRIGLALMNTR